MSYQTPGLLIHTQGSGPQVICLFDFQVFLIRIEEKIGFANFLLDINNQKWDPKWGPKEGGGHILLSHLFGVVEITTKMGP